MHGKSFLLDQTAMCTMWVVDIENILFFLKKNLYHITLYAIYAKNVGRS